MRSKKKWGTVVVVAVAIVVGSLYARSTSVVEVTASPAPGQESVNETLRMANKMLGPDQVITDLTRQGNTTFVEWQQTGRGDLCPITPEPFDVLRGMIGLSISKSFSWTYGPWNASFCSTNTKITHTAWNKPEHSNQQAWSWLGQRYVQWDNAGAHRTKKFEGQFGWSGGGSQYPWLRVNFDAGQSVTTAKGCRGC